MEKNPQDIIIESLDTMLKESAQRLVTDSTNLLTSSLKELKSDLENLLNVIEQNK